VTQATQAATNKNNIQHRDRHHHQQRSHHCRVEHRHSHAIIMDITITTIIIIIRRCFGSRVLPLFC